MIFWIIFHEQVVSKLQTNTSGNKDTRYEYMTEGNSFAEMLSSFKVIRSDFMVQQLFMHSNYREAHLLVSNHIVSVLPHEKDVRGLQILIWAYLTEAQGTDIFLYFQLQLSHRHFMKTQNWKRPLNFTHPLLKQS